MEEEFKRWTAKHKAQLVLDILQGRNVDFPKLETRYK
jgi:hypothetical protein